ncbi:MAG TPA: MBL fold metallo-hydrolase [Planctomycetota bacterium]|nr:MBL fold metallo-hydrolase [Planctomycetota bacterium]
MDTNPFRPERNHKPAPRPRLRLGAFASGLLSLASFGCIGPRLDAAGQPRANGDLRISGSAATLPADQPAAADELQVHFIDVGTGDCVWIHTGDDGIAGNSRLDGLNIIIDGGDNGAFGRIDGYTPASDYLATLLPLGTHIECLILSHPHSDHCGGVVGFLEDYPVRTIPDLGFDKTEPGQLPAASYSII